MGRKDWVVATALALCAIGLIACGGGGSEATGSGPGGGDDAAAEESRLKMAECLREHGIDVPDPTPGEKGLIIEGQKGDGPGGANLDDPAMEEAMEACEDEVGFEPPDISPEQEEEMQEDMLAFAQCMREHGVDMPDPEFGEGGKVKMRMGGPGGSGDMDEPAVEAAQEACQGEMPGGSFGLKTGP